MKKKTIIICIGIFAFSAISILLVLNLTKTTYTVDWLQKNSDYMIVAQRNILKCVERETYYAMCDLRGKEPYKQDGKVYTEMYISCNCDKYVGEKITVITDGYYFKEDDYCLLFLKCVDEEKGLYTPIEDKTGIIKIKKNKIYPMDSSIIGDLKKNFSDASSFYYWFEEIAEQKIQTAKNKNSEPTTERETLPTTAAPSDVS